MKVFSLLDNFLENDIQDEEMYREIVYFIKCNCYRYGEYVGNRCVVRKKLHDDNIVIFHEEDSSDRGLTITRIELVKTIDQYARKQGFTRDTHGDITFFDGTDDCRSY